MIRRGAAGGPPRPGRARRPREAVARDAPEAASPPPPLRHVLRQARERVAALLARPVPPRALALALALLAMYLRLGQPLYLFAGLWVAFRLALRMMDGLPRRRLFD